MTCRIDSIAVWISLLQKCSCRLRVLMACEVDSIAVGTLLLQESFRFWEASCAPPHDGPKTSHIDLMIIVRADDNFSGPRLQEF